MCEFRKQEVHGSCLSSVRMHVFSPHLAEVSRASLARVTELCGAAFLEEEPILFYGHLDYRQQGGHPACTAGGLGLGLGLGLGAP